MRMTTTLRQGAAFAFLVALPATAWADLTPEQLWKELQDEVAASGQTLSATATGGAGRLVLTGVTTRGGTKDVDLTQTWPDITLSAQGGDVAIQLPDSYPVNTTTKIAAGAVGSDTPASTTSATYDVSHPGASIVASGSPGDVTYRIEAPTMSVSKREFTQDGEASDRELDIEVSLRGFAGTRRVQSTASQSETVQSFKSENTTIAFNTQETEDSQAMLGQVNIADIAFTSTNTLPAAASRALRDGAVSTMLTQGEWETQVTHGAVDMTVDSGGRTVANATVAGGTTLVTVEDGRVASTGQTDMVRVEVPIEGMPAPLEFTLDGLTNAFAMPLTPSDTTKEMSVKLALENLGANDAAWAMIDPAAVLSHDPAQLVLDVSGQIRWLYDLFKPELLPEDATAQVDIDSATLNSLSVSAAGASLTGKGAFTFSDAAPGETQQAAGMVDLALKGGDALLDNLVTMGLVSQEQAMGARMMVGSFTRPGEGPDSLVSRIELGADGTISANGRRVR